KLLAAVAAPRRPEADHQHLAAMLADQDSLALGRGPEQIDGRGLADGRCGLGHAGKAQDQQARGPQEHLIHPHSPSPAHPAPGQTSTGPRARSRGRRYPAATGADIDLLYIPERSKQQARRWPEASLSQAVAMRLTRVSAFLPELIQWIQSRRATAVMSSQVARAAGLPDSALRRSAGSSGSGSRATGVSTSGTVSPAAAPAASRRARSTFSQWLPRPSGASVAWNGWPASSPSTLTMLRVGSFALAAAGSTRKVQAALAGSAGRSSLALQRTVGRAVDSGMGRR